MNTTRNWKLSFITLSCLGFSLFGAPTIITVNTYTDTPTNQNTGGLYGVNTDLRGAINHINLNPLSGGYTIVFQDAGQSISLGALLPILNLVQPYPLTIDGGTGAPTIIDGQSTYRGFFAHQGGVSLKNLQIQNVMAVGGSGGNPGGGGGMGAGAALFVNDTAQVTISNVAIHTSLAIGGNGGTASVAVAGGGGGGGLGGVGGTSFPFSPINGGGGGGGFGGKGGSCEDDNGAGGGGIDGGMGHSGHGGDVDVPSGFMAQPGGGFGALGAGSGAGGSAGGAMGGGGGDGNGGSGGGGGGGGIEGLSSPGAAGGDGGVFGGGGGSSTSGTGSRLGGNGGFGGGGGGNCLGGINADDSKGGFGGGGGAGGTGAGYGGNGGFGGGGGGGSNIAFSPLSGMGGVGGGSADKASSVGQGGGGAAFGGAIFVNGAGSLTILDSFSSQAGNSVTAGTGFNPGWAAGGDCFLLSGASFTLDPNGGAITFANSIADDSSASFVGVQPGTVAGSSAGASLTIGNVMSNPGTVYFPSTNNSTYSGPTFIQQGTFALNGSITSPVTVFSSGKLQGVGSVVNSVEIQAGGKIHAGNSIGTLTVGNLTLQSGSIMELDIDLSPGSNASSVYIVNGTLTLNGATLSLGLISESSPPTAHTYDFIHYTGSSPVGQFNPVVANFPLGVYPVLHYLPNLVTLELIPFANLIGQGVSLSSNEKVVLNYLFTISGETSLQSILNSLMLLTPDELKSSLNSISPARNNAAPFLLVNPHLK